MSDGDCPTCGEALRDLFPLDQEQDEPSQPGSWADRKDTRKNDMAHGITFLMHERRAHNVRAEVALNETKVHADGTASLTLALDQYKYGDELIAQLYTSTPPRTLVRRADGWTRVQIYLGTADLETAATLERIARRIEARIAEKGAK